MENQYNNENGQSTNKTIKEDLEKDSNQKKNKGMTSSGIKFLIATVIILLIVIVGVIIYGVVILKQEDNCNQKYNSNNLNESNFYYNPNVPIADKPIIYLYPAEETEVTVQLKKIDNLTCTYPKYPNSGWRVIAQPNGDLIDLDTNKKLYSLYYEAENTYPFEVTEDGFCIKGEDTASFLEEKLEVLGLNYKEKEEFIVYWLPKLEQNSYNYIRFATAEEIKANMPLEVTPTPDNIIRILMVFKGLEEPIEVKEQELTTPSRTGFTVVEWGGTEIE